MVEHGMDSYLVKPKRRMSRASFVGVSMGMVIFSGVAPILLLFASAIIPSLLPLWIVTVVTGPGA